jgi:Amt family ammonium transporter
MPPDLITPEVTAAFPALAWLLCASALVFFMQAGFAAVEAGAVRHKNSINVALKNVVDLCASFAAFFVVGYSLMFGASWEPIGLVGTPRLFLDGVEAVDPAGSDVFTLFPLAMFLFQVTFCSTAATIVSGGVAERCRFLAYVLVSVGVAGVLYPLFGHWVWGGGWLADLGYHDFAGSSVVHLLGAGVTLAGLYVLGPREGRFGADGSVRRIPASSMPMQALGVFILAFGWIGFNGGSAPLGVQTPMIIVTTLAAGCFGGLAAMLLVWAARGAPEADLILNGVLGGLVAITAGSNCVSLPASALIGMLGGGAVVFGTWVMERLRLDDAVGAVPVHGFAGALGVLCAALFVDPAWLAANRPGLTQGGFLAVQALGIVSCIAWSFAGGLLLWWLVGRITSLRIGRDEERVGMNYSEHKVDDALQGLLQATEAAVQARTGPGPTLEDVRDGDLVPLARAIRNLVERQARTRASSARWASALAEAHAAIEAQLQYVAVAALANRDELAEARRSLEVIRTYLRGEARKDEFAPVLEQLVIALSQRIDDAARTLLPIEQAQARLQAEGGRIGRIGAALRAAGADAPP